MKRKNQWMRFLAVLLTVALCIPGMTSFASTANHEECYVHIILGAGETENDMESFILPDGTVNTSYSHSLKSESCGLKPERWSVREGNELPSGLSLSENGRLSGKPQTAGTYEFIVQVELGKAGITAGEDIASGSNAHPGDSFGNLYVDSARKYEITIKAAKKSSSSDSDGSGSSSSVQKTGWYLDSVSDWYYYDSNKVLHKGWLLDSQDHFWYYLDPVTGKMNTGWMEIGGKSYYFNPESPILTWEKRGDSWYYKGIEGSRPKGSMYCSETTPDGHQVGEDGARTD